MAKSHLVGALFFLACGRDSPSPITPITPPHVVEAAPHVLDAAPSAVEPARALPTPRPRAWRWVNPSPQGEKLSAVVADLSCGAVAVGDEGTVLRSVDDGVTWTVRTWAHRWDLQFATLDGTTLYAIGTRERASALLAAPECGAGEPRVLQTFDRMTDGAVNDLASDAAGRLYLTTLLHKRGRVLCSVDHGATVRVCDERKTPIYGLHVLPTGGAWVAGGNGGVEGGVVRESLDQGQTWRTVGSHLGSLLYGVWGDAAGARLVATGSDEIVTRATAGGRWASAAPLMQGGGSMMLGPDDAPFVRNDFWVGVTGNPRTGTYLTLGSGPARGDGFSPSTHEISRCTTCTGQFRGATTTTSGTWLAVGWEGAIVRSTDDAATWQAASSNVLGDGRGFAALRSDGHHLFVLQGTRMMRSDDEARTFVTLGALTAEELPTTVVSTADLGTFAVDEQVLLVPRPGHGAIARSTDLGVTFADVPVPHDAGHAVTHVWSNGDGVFYASGAGGSMLRTLDRGATWSRLTIATSDDLVTGWSYGREVYTLSTVGHVFRSRDGGDSWKARAFTRPLLAVTGASADEVLVIGRDGNAYRSVDHGETWVPGGDIHRDVRGVVFQAGRLTLSTLDDDHLYVSLDHGKTFQKELAPMRDALLFPDGAGGLYLARENGFSGLMRFD